MMTGGPATVIEAFEVFPVPAFPDVTWTLLFLTLAVVPCTFTETVHDVAAARVPPESVMLPAPATGANVPPQVLVVFGGEATTRPACRLSVKPIPVSVEMAFGF